MPIFFYFSGRSSSFSKDNFLMWTYKKTTRLILPLIFGTLFIVIPTQYIALPYGDTVIDKSDRNISFWEYIPLFFTQDFPSNGFEVIFYFLIKFPLIFFYLSYSKKIEFINILILVPCLSGFL